MELTPLGFFDPTRPFGPTDRTPLTRVEEAVTRVLDLAPRPFFFDSIGTVQIDEDLQQQFGSDFSGVPFGSFGVTGSAFPNVAETDLPRSFAIIQQFEGQDPFRLALVNPTGEAQSGSSFGLLSFDPSSGQRISETIDGDVTRTQLFNGGFIFSEPSVGASEGGSRLTDLNARDFSRITVASDELFTVIGGADDDVITGTGAFVSFLGGAGDDRLEAIDAFAVTLTGGSGDDVIAVRQTEQAQINAGAGNDVIEIGNLVRTAGVIVDEFSGDDVINIGDSAFGDILVGFQEGFDRDQLRVERLDGDSFRVTLEGEEGSLTINGVRPGAAQSVTLAFGERNTFNNTIALAFENAAGQIVRPQLREPGLELDSRGDVVRNAEGFAQTQPGFGLEGPGQPILSEDGEPILIRLTSLGAVDVDAAGIPRIASEDVIANTPAGRGIQIFENGDIRDSEGRPITDRNNNILRLSRDGDGEILFDANGVPILERIILRDPTGAPATDPRTGEILFQQHTGEVISEFAFDPESDELNVDLLDVVTPARGPSGGFSTTA